MDVDTSNSIYLSFDAESTMFKTLEASSIDLEAGDHNSTMEQEQANEVDFVRNAAPSPLRQFVPNKILHEYKALCSTPSKDQLMRNVVITRGSATKHCVDFGAAFLDDIEEEKPTLPLEENKENTQPEYSEASTLSMSSSEITTTVIERKMMALSTTTSGEQESQDVNADTAANEATDVNTVGTVNGVSAVVEAKSTLPTAAALKQRRSMLAVKNVRKSICEPDLKSNRPSRILAPNTKKRASLTANNHLPAPKGLKNKESELPNLLKTMMKMASVEQTDKASATSATANGGGNMNSHSSKLPTKSSNQAEKRPYNMTQRMSILVKTTLNSPARKIARRSVCINPQLARKSMLPKKLESAEARTMPSVAARRTIVAPSDKHSGNSLVNRQSIYALAKPTGAAKLTQLPTRQPPKLNKVEPTFTCSICSNKFSLKSLLDAHRRSHEDGTPLFVKKAAHQGHSVAAGGAATAQTPSGERQCKYCDKKFALTRALHIHLLQNCAKIPPNEKRKLQYTELNHVEKAQLPSVFHVCSNSNSSTLAPTVSSNGTSDMLLTMPSKSHSNLSNAPTASSAESLIERTKDITDLAMELVTAVDSVLTKMQPPKNVSVKKKTTASAHAHAGVYRTPSKGVPCDLCKRTFKSVLEYTDHSMTMHSTNSVETENS